MRQTDRQTGRQTGREADRQADTNADDGPNLCVSSSLLNTATKGSVVSSEAVPASNH